MKSPLASSFCLPPQSCSLFSSWLSHLLTILVSYPKTSAMSSRSLPPSPEECIVVRLCRTLFLNACSFMPTSKQSAKSLSSLLTFLKKTKKKLPRMWLMIVRSETQVGFGGTCLDYFAVVPTFPKPGDKTRCISMEVFPFLWLWFSF